jgi:uncharacterized membrane protein YfcA
MPIFLEHAFDLPLVAVIAAVVLASLFVGIGKAGFGGGVGLVSPTLMAQVMPVRLVLALMQPLLMICDAAAIWAWWRKWDLRNLWLLLPGTVVGVAGGAVLLTTMPERYLRLGLGAIALTFVALQLMRRRSAPPDEAFRPVWWQGTLCGAVAGFCSILAHAAGPIITLFLVPQGLGKERFVATTVIYYACLNLVKLPFYIGTGLLTTEVGLSALWLAPAVFLGTLAGVWMNRSVSEKTFTTVVYAVVVVSAGKLLIG